MLAQSIHRCRDIFLTDVMGKFWAHPPLQILDKEQSNPCSILHPMQWSLKLLWLRLIELGLLYLKRNLPVTILPSLCGRSLQWHASGGTESAKGMAGITGLILLFPGFVVHINPFLECYSTNLNGNWKARLLNDDACSWCQHFMRSCVADVVKGEKVKPIFEEPPNPTNVEASLQRIKANDPSLIEINLNNIKVGAVFSFMSSQEGLFKAFQSPCLLSSNFVSFYCSEKAGHGKGVRRELLQRLQGHQCLILN